MTSGISTPRYPGSRSHGTAYKPVTVMHTDRDKRICLVRDSLNTIFQVRCDIMRAKGNLPEPGEMWYIDRQYDIWIFGAILNGTTRGVEVSNVTDLPETIDQITADRAAGDAQIKAQTLGQIQAKGDILAATQGQTVVRQPAGALNESLVADPSTTTGLVYRDLTGRPAGFSGLSPATAAGRWVGNTAFGAPTTGTWQVGDWVSTQSGYRWVCTVAGTPGTWVERTNAVENRVTTLENANKGGKHIWTLNNPGLASGQDLVCAGYSTYFSDGIATVSSGGLFYWNKAGRWSLNIEVSSDGGAASRMDIYILFGSPNSLGPNNTSWGDSRFRGSGFAGAGFLRQQITWSGWVYPADMSVPWALHTASYGAGNQYNNIVVRAEYLGPFS